MSLDRAKRGSVAAGPCPPGRRGCLWGAALVVVALSASRVEAHEPPKWTTVYDGVEETELQAKGDPAFGDARITVLRADLARVDLRLFSALREHLNDAPTAPQWAKRRDLIAVTNAGMFQPGGMPVGFAKSDGAAVNPQLRKDFRAMLVADPIDPKLPAVQILDSECDDVQTIAKSYRVALQSIRMVSCKGRNTWGTDSKRWSAAAVAVDSKGRVLFLHARHPFTMHVFVDQVLAAPLDVTRMLYMEGGPEASLVTRADGDGAPVVRVGSYETGFNENDSNKDAWALPNVLGVVEKKRGAAAQR